MMPENNTIKDYERLRNKIRKQIKSGGCPPIFRDKINLMLQHQTQAIKHQDEERGRFGPEVYAARLEQLSQLLENPQVNYLALSDCLSQWENPNEETYKKLRERLIAHRDNKKLPWIDKLLHSMNSLQHFAPSTLVLEEVLNRLDNKDYANAQTYLTCYQPTLHWKFNDLIKELNIKKDQCDPQVQQKLQKVISIVTDLYRDPKQDINKLIKVLESTQNLLNATSKKQIAAYLEHAEIMQGHPNKKLKRLGEAMMALGVALAIALGFVAGAAVFAAGGAVRFFSGQRTGLSQAAEEFGEAVRADHSRKNKP